MARFGSRRDCMQTGMQLHLDVCVGGSGSFFWLRAYRGDTFGELFGDLFFLEIVDLVLGALTLGRWSGPHVVVFWSEL